MSDRPRIRPPAWARWLMAATCPRREREFLLGDLEEEFRHLVERSGAGPAGAWYARQALTSVLPNLRHPGSQRRRLRRRSKGDSAMSALLSDLRHALRELRLSPGFAAVAILTLGIGIGANTALYSVLEAVVLRPLPFADPESLVLLHNYRLDQPLDRSQVSFPDYRDYRERNRSFVELAAWEPERPSLTGDDTEPRRLVANSVTHTMFGLLGLEMTLGRGFEPSEDALGAPGVAVISHAFWRDHFGSASDVLGGTLRLNGELYEVVGVLPSRFADSGSGGVLPIPEAQVWLPWHTSSSAEIVEIRGVHRARVLARMRDGVSLEQAQADVAEIARQLAEEYPRSNAEEGAWLEPARSSLTRHVRSTLLLLSGAVAVVLLIVCANIASLLLGRGVERQSEVAIRTALGAGRGQLMRQLLTESLVLAILGGGLGVLIGAFLVRSLVALAPGGIPRLETAGLSLEVLVFSLSATLLTGLLFGLAPAWQCTSRDPIGGSSRTVASRRRPRLRQGLVVTEIALACALVIGAGLLLRSLRSVLDVDPGFLPQQLIAMPMELPLPFVSPEWPQAVNFYRSAVERARALPGVESAAVGFLHPLDAGWGTTFDFQRRPEPEPGDRPDARFRPVTPGYFETVGVPLLRGRGIEERDVATSPGVIVVNQSFVDRFFEEGEDPLGAGIEYSHWWGAGPDSYEIVGVVADVLYGGPADGRRPAMYFAHAQQPVVMGHLMVRYRGDSETVLGALRKEIWELDPEMPLDEVIDMSQRLDFTVAQRRFTTGLLTAFAALALLLAGLGIYGVLAFLVQQRRREIGVRMALGARIEDVVRLVVSQGAMLALIGCVIGLLASLGATRLLASQLFEVSRIDPLTFAVVPGVLAGAALLSCWVPVKRAARIDPVKTLREE